MYHHLYHTENNFELLQCWWWETPLRFITFVTNIWKLSPIALKLNFHRVKSWKDHTNIYTSTTATPVQSRSNPTSGVTKDTSGSKSASSDSGDKFDLKYEQMKVQAASSSNLVDAENCPKTEPNWDSFKKINKKKTKLLVPVKGWKIFCVNIIFSKS